jgi:Domain of unknown function (DUF4276)
MIQIQPIVEGPGDRDAVPILIRRIAQAHERYDVEVLRPHERGDLPVIKPRFDDFLRTALFKGVPVLWVLDYDCDDCTDVERDIEALSTRASRIAAPQKTEFAFMVKEFESLFLADHETTRTVFPDIPQTTVFPQNPEAIRGAKEWPSKCRPKGLTYKETTDQAKLTAQLNLDRLRERSPSFCRFEAAVLNLLN